MNLQRWLKSRRIRRLFRKGRMPDLFTLLSHVPDVLGYIPHNSRAQLGQDIFAWLESGCKRDGYFVEFGAADGLLHSNTYMLEKEFGWRGLLAEPAKRFHNALHHNRGPEAGGLCAIETDCVWKCTGERVQFKEAECAVLSTLVPFSANDSHAKTRADNGRIYEVNTISLNDMLAKHNCPNDIDYLSIDTEGSEYEILRHFDFDKYNIQCITCEHNFGAVQQNVLELLLSKGYKRKLEGFTGWDDWYAKK